MNNLLTILFLGFLTSCALTPERRVFNPHERRQDRIEQCVHRFIDKGVVFLNASKECARTIFEKIER